MLTTAVRYSLYSRKKVNEWNHPFLSIATIILKDCETVSVVDSTVYGDSQFERKTLFRNFRNFLHEGKGKADEMTIDIQQLEDYTVYHVEKVWRG